MPSPAPVFRLQTSADRLLTAVMVGVDVMCDEARFKVSGIAHGVGSAAGHIQILGQDELHAFYQHIPAGRVIMRRDCQGFHSALVLISLLVNLAQHDGQCDTLAGADILYVHIQLKDTSLGFHIDVASVVHEGIR